MFGTTPPLQHATLQNMAGPQAGAYGFGQGVNQMSQGYQQPVSQYGGIGFGLSGGGNMAQMGQMGMGMGLMGQGMGQGMAGMAGMPGVAAPGMGGTPGMNTHSASMASRGNGLVILCSSPRAYAGSRKETSRTRSRI